MTDAPVEVRIRAPVKPTEEPQRVARAVLNLFPDGDVEEGTTELRATAPGLDHLAELIDRHQIPDSARKAMVQSRERGTGVTRFQLGKQAAFVGKPNFDPPESALGNLEVEVETPSEDDLMRVLYTIAPDTTVPPELARVPPSQRPATDEDREES